MASFFRELKRRNVYKVAAAYVVVAWLLLQLASILFPTFEAPAWVMKVFIAVVALGFPLALIFAWAFELTPEGIKRTEDVAPVESITHRTGRKLPLSVAVVALLAIGLLLFQMLRPRDDGARHGSPWPVQDQQRIPEKSIAVLPFESLSEDKANAYFATGVQDEILTRLAKVAELKVISRTSTQQYQSKPGSVAEIAKQLGVAHILEGSVQKAGDSVRVNVQLIKADTDAHLWAETYDRKLAEIFQVQTDIALRIASALEAKLTGREQRDIATVGTTNPQAYDAYLRGLTFDTSQSGEETQIALESFRRAVELDPNFAPAWAALANRESFYYAGNRTPEQLTRARHAMEMAVKLQPDASESYAAAGSFYYYCPKDFERALDALAKAHARSPNNAFVIMLTGAVKRRQGKLDESIELMQRAGILDPRNNDVWVNLARSYRGARKFEQAHAMFDRALNVAPQQHAILAEKGEAFIAAGDLQSGDNLLAPLPRTLASEAIDDYVWISVLRRDFPRAIALLSEAIEKGGTDEELFNGRLFLAYLRSAGGRPNEAQPIFHETIRVIEERRAQGDLSLWLGDERIGIAAELGDRATVEREAQAMLERTSGDRWRYPVSEAQVAAAFAVLGDADQAIPHIERAVSLPAHQGLTPAYLRLDPVWDKIRDDPRFRRLTEGNP
ncbi:MAG: tetratricopeptide repeat protein [Chthoniobacterales bacterium]|nr:tetratricopeptide repeat protein [Chthoniobacterales bacterium]